MTRAERLKAFREAEASLRLEGLDPTHSSVYRDTKAKVVNGAMTTQDAKEAISAYHRSRNSARVAAA